MSTAHKKVWHDIDNKHEEMFLHGARFVREKDHNTISLDCPVCKVLIATVEDVSSVKSCGACSNCYDIYYYPNKEKWEKGWRPVIINKNK